MALIIVTFADLGKKENLKTPTISPVIDKFYKKGELKQVFCRRKKDFYFKNTYAGVKSFSKFLQHSIKKTIKPDLDIRKREFGLIDSIASKKINAQKGDVVVFHPESSFPETFKKVRASGAKIVGVTTVAHSFYSQKETRKEKLKFEMEVKEQKNSLKKTGKDNFLEEMDYFIALSEFAKKTYIKAGYTDEKVRVATTDIDLNRFQKTSLKNDNIFRVVCVAQFSLMKGLHYLLEAWKSFEVSDKELVIVGSFDKLPRFLKEKYLEQINKDHTIKHVGFTSEPEKYLKNASTFVFPSLFPEGCPKVVLEAMACALPIVTTPNGQAIIEDGKDGFIVPRRDVNAMKEKIEHLYENPEVAKDIGEKARKSIKNKERFAKQVYEIYKEINSKNE